MKPTSKPCDHVFWVIGTACVNGDTAIMCENCGDIRYRKAADLEAVAQEPELQG